MNDADPPGAPVAAVVGASGFVGGAAADHLAADGFSVRPVAAPRIAAEFGSPAASAAAAWATEHAGEFDELVTALCGASVVVNAAGLATATSAESPALWGANAVLPAVVASAAVLADVPRYVHVSSAAVLGSRPMLDEQPYNGIAHSPYARSKGAGELAAAEPAATASTHVVVFRPTSVLGAARPIASRLARVLRSRWLLVPAGSTPLPVAHIDSTGAAIAFLATVDQAPPLALHPWEGMTTQSLAAAFGRARPIRRLPRPIAFVAVRAVRRLARGGPLAGHARRIELLWDGQHQTSSLPDLGFDVGDAAAAFERLGAQLD